MEYTLSFNHLKHMGISFSVKNASPSYLASAGYCSTTESLILQFLSSERSLSAGTIDCCKFSRPITLFSSSSLLKRFRRTSELSSLRSAKKIGKMCSLVGPFSIILQMESKFSARAYLTYGNWSVLSLFKLGMIYCIKILASKITPKSESLLTAAVLTSDSESSKN